MKTLWVLTLAILAQATGDILLSKGMKHTALSELLANFQWSLILVQVAGNPTIWLGTALLTLFFLLHAAALSWADLSFVLPATSFGYVVNVAFARYFLNEPVSWFRWAGTVLISLGVVVVARSGVRLPDRSFSQPDLPLIGTRKQEREIPPLSPPLAEKGSGRESQCELDE
jgi:drug/metabolite transporter (DMT)-like permease